MPKVVFLQADGQRIEIQAAPGTSVMRAAIDGNVAGIEADCGGCLSCATCHVYVEAPDLSRLEPLSSDEDEMLQGVAAPRLPTSRLSCQLVLTNGHEGLTLRLPARQS